MFWISIVMTIVANVAYNLCSKMTAAIHPLAALSITYTVALTTCLALYPLCANQPDLINELKQANWTSAVLGVAIVLLESGFVLTFRYGWSLGSAALFSNVAVSIVLIPVAIFAFRESLSTVNILGVVVAIIGLTMMAK
jgi:hypothetical protein